MMERFISGDSKQNVLGFAFFSGTKFLLGYKRPKWFFVLQNAFSGYENLLTISQVKGVSLIVELLLTFGRSKAARVGFNGRRPQSAAENSSTQNRKSSTKKQKQQHQQKSKIQQHKQKSIENNRKASLTNNKEHQTAVTQEKSTKRISKSRTNMKNSSTNSSKSSTNSKISAPRGTQAAAKAVQPVQIATKTAKATTQTRGPRRLGFKGLFLIGVYSWNFGFSRFFFFFLRYRWILE